MQAKSKQIANTITLISKYARDLIDIYIYIYEFLSGTVPCQLGPVKVLNLSVLLTHATEVTELHSVDRNNQ